MFSSFRDKWESPPSTSWKVEHFSVLALFSTCPSLRTGTPNPIKILFSKLTKLGLSVHKVWSHEIKNCSLRKHWNWVVFGYIFSIIGKKSRWWLNGYHGYQKQKWFINSNILETLTDSPKSPPSLKFLEQRVHQLGGGIHLPSNNIVRSKKLWSGGVKLRLHSAIYRTDYFVLMLRHCANLNAIGYEPTSLNRIIV